MAAAALKKLTLSSLPLMLPADDVVSSIELLIITAVAEAAAEPNEVVGAAVAATAVVETDDGDGIATPLPLDTFVETVTTTACGTVGAVDVVVVVVVVVTVAAELTPSIDAAF